MAIQPDPKRHHYIPQFFLKGFSEDGKKLWVFDREKKEFRQESILRTAFQNKFYTYQVKGKEENLEGVFSQVESLAKPILEKVTGGEEINNQEKADLAMFLAIMWVRVPDFKKRSEEGAEKMFKKYNKLRFSDEQSLKALAAKHGDNITDKDIKEAKELITSERYDVKFPPNYWLGVMLKLSLEAARAFISMNWLVVHVKKKFAFVTSDNPVVLVPPKDYDPRGFYGVGFLTPGASKVVSLSSSHCLLIGDLAENPWIKHVEEGEKDFLRWVNYETSVNSDRFVYSPDKGKLEKIVKVTKIDKFLTKERLVIN